MSTRTIRERLDPEACRGHIRDGAAPFYRGQVNIVSGVLVEAQGVPAAVGELGLTAGKRVYLLIKASALRCLT